MLSSTGNVGVAPDTAGDAAGKIFAEYGLEKDGSSISLKAENVSCIIVKDDDANKWTTLTPNTDDTLWFNIEADADERTFVVVTKEGVVYTATLDWENEIQEANWVATGREGIRPGTGDTYVEYELLDGEENVISLKVGVAKLFASKGEDGKWKSHELNTDTTLWFKADNETGDYEYFMVAEDGTMYKTTLVYGAPEEVEEP